MREFRDLVEGLSARAVLNYVIFEVEHGADPRSVIREALELAERDFEDLKKVIEFLRSLLGDSMLKTAPK